MIHWTWFIFLGIIIFFVIRIGKTMKNNSDYSWDLEFPFLLILLVAFILIWGGVFWW